MPRPRKKPSSKVFFHFQHPIILRDRVKLKEFIESIFKQEKSKLEEIHYVFCSDAFLVKINQKYLNHEFYTDILTFNLGSEDKIIGEIYISAQRVKENARNYETSAESELHRVIFHGVLHLVGYNDQTDDAKKTMRSKENSLLKHYSRFRANN